MSTPMKTSSSSTQRSDDLHPPPSTFTTNESPHPWIDLNKQKRMKRCHGNKKIQRFRRKCRAKRMKPATIAKQVQKRFNVLAKTTTPITTSINPISNKRKRGPTTNRVVRSTSEISIVQSPPKKIANTKSQLLRTSMATSENIYRRSTYLKRLSPVLLQALRLKLDYALKKRNEQSFVCERLQLLDKRYCLELYQSLWQSCLTMSSEQQIWPDQLHALANTEDSHLCLQFIEKFISGIRQQLGQLDRALVTQGSSYPTTLAVDKLDQRLKEYVHSQQKTFRHKMNAQLSELKQNIEEKQLYRTLFSGNLVQAQDVIRRLVSIQDNQLEPWKELLMLEQRILSKFLPENFDQLQAFVCVDCYTPSIANDCAVRYRLKKLKILQESKRSWLDMHLRAYVLKIEEQDRYYQSELVQLEQSMNASVSLS